MKTAAIVLAAGQGKRMNSNVAKQYMLLQDKPVLYYALKVFEESFVDEVILVTGQGEEEYCQKQIVERFAFNKVKKIIHGGKERYHSVYAGLSVLNDADICFIHDGARPFLTQDILENTLQSAQKDGACVVGVPVTDTIKVVDVNGFVEATPDRARLWSIQTPQVFRFDIIKEAYDILMQEEEKNVEKGIRVTDDAMVVETFLKYPVRIIEGSYTNIKLTTPADLLRAEAILRERNTTQK